MSNKAVTEAIFKVEACASWDCCCRERALTIYKALSNLEKKIKCKSRLRGIYCRRRRNHPGECRGIKGGITWHWFRSAAVLGFSL